MVNQTREVLKGKKPAKRLYAIHEPKVAVIKKGKANKPCEFGSLVRLSVNDVGIILSHAEYQHNISGSKTVGKVINGIKANTVEIPRLWQPTVVLISPIKSSKTAAGVEG